MSEDQPQPPASGPGVPPQPGPPQPAYGYPQQGPPPAPGQGAPPQSAYGYPQQGPPAAGYQPPPQQPYGPGYPPPPGQQQPYQGRYGATTFRGDAESPDWSALASQHEEERRRRKRNLVALSTLGALLLIGGIVTAAMLLTPKDKPVDPVAGPSTSASAKASASASASPKASDPSSAAPAPKSAEEALSRASTDKAPVSLDALFPNATLTVDGQTLQKAATEHGDQCGAGTVNGLGVVLEKENCRDIYLATYLSDKAAVTVGVVVFDSKTQADRAQSKVVGNIKPLRSAQTPRFCPDLAQCAFSNKAFGRYIVFTTAGNADMTPVTDGNPATKQAAAGVSKQVLDDLQARGQAALSNAG
ncbi:hypothetical protein [Kitasatospora sp. NPDC088783]|uniref:hypothetical protein n=1 Tax=Kitasatospora sp. NPDC088783 TaxID=3364077 RepID=UPI003815BD8E